MRKDRKDHGEAVRIRKDIIDVARRKSEETGASIKRVIEDILAPVLCPKSKK